MKRISVFRRRGLRLRLRGFLFGFGVLGVRFRIHRIHRWFLA